MYNRYIPQSDGSYQRSRVQEAPPLQRQKPPTDRPQPRPEPCPPPPDPTPCQSCVHNQQPRRPMPPRPKKAQAPMGIGSFLRQLLPRDFDTEDLLIILLLLLMAGDCQEDQNSALLTLVLYLFM